MEPLQNKSEITVEIKIAIYILKSLGKKIE
jgi:hypothetical protein